MPVPAGVAVTAVQPDPAALAPWSGFALFCLYVAVVLALVGAVVGEFIGASRGLGALIIAAQGSMDTPLMFAVLLLISLLGLVAYQITLVLERRLLRRLSTGELAQPRWLYLEFPVSWHYHPLRALDHMRKAGVEPDERMAEAIEIMRASGPVPRAA